MIVIVGVANFVAMESGGALTKYYPNLHPYLEPLLYFLKDDAELAKYFQAKDFFRPIGDIDKGLDELTKTGCIDYKSLWIGPSASTAINTDTACNIGRDHGFQVIVNIPCGEGLFVLGHEDPKDSDSPIKLQGSFMELSHIGSVVIDAISRFSKAIFSLPVTSKGYSSFDEIIFVGDRILQPTQNKTFVTLILDYSIQIHNGG